jgi:hypothetical protein
VSKRLRILLRSFVLAMVLSTTAKSDSLLSAGFSGGDKALPYVALNVNDAWAISQWRGTALYDLRLQNDDGFGDAQVKTEWHGETNLRADTLVEIDAAYGFERDKEDAIKRTHKVGLDFGLARQLDDSTLKFDVGLESKIHQDTTQKGFSSLDRSAEDFIDGEAAVRYTLFNNATLKPFLEVALLQRDYLEKSRRAFRGAEGVGGVTLAGKNLTGDIALIVTYQNTRTGGGALAIGPNVDVKWKASDATEISLALVAALIKIPQAHLIFFLITPGDLNGQRHWQKT